MIVSYFPIIALQQILIHRAAARALAAAQLDVTTCEAETFTQHLAPSLKLLYLFGLVYLVGYGLEIVVAFNNLINLDGTWCIQ